LTGRDDTALASVVSDEFLIFLENGLQGQREWATSGTTSTCTKSSEVDLSPQDSNKSRRHRNFLCSWFQLK